MAAITLACSSDAAAPSSRTGTPAADPATDAYAALEAADYDALPHIVERLDAAFEKNPDSGRFAFYSGVMRFWRTTGGEQDPAAALEDILT